VPFRIKGTLDYNPLKLDLAQLVRDAESRRPEVKVRQNDIESARQQATIVRAPVLPRVDAFVSYESLNETSKSAPQDIDHGYVVGLNGTWQIFDGFASAGRVKAARALESVARSSREALVLAVQTQVLSAYYKLQQAEATIASQANTVTLAQEALVLSESSFAAGLGTQLDVLTSRLELTRARTVELNARHDYLVASAQLQRAVSSDYQWLDQPLKVPAPAPVIPTVLPPATQAQLTPEVPARNPAVEPPNALFLRPGSGETRLRLNPDPS
jgi:outer membrane protein TolC